MTDLLSGVRVIEMPAIGPIPFCAMTLADLGAEVIRIDRPVASDLGLPVPPECDFLARGKRSIVLDLKHPDGLAAAQQLIERSDILLEGFRPGVMERLGLGPAQCMARQPALVYGRVSGWGATGEQSMRAGHDINFLAAAGVLGAVGTREQPLPPLNLVGDYGSALQLVSGVLAGCLHARVTGRGAVIETSILRGAASLMTFPYSLLAAGQWSAQRGDNVLDGAAPYYRTYAASDGRFMAVGAIEPAFYAIFLTQLGAGAAIDPASQLDRATWPATAETIARLFKAHPQSHWASVFGASDACCTPVLTMEEAGRDAHNLRLGVYVSTQAGAMPGPGIANLRAPQLSLPVPGNDTVRVLRDSGYTGESASALIASGAAYCAQSRP